MIINTGQRTDIPAFYSKWMMNRIKEGYVMVRNPYYPNTVTRFSLDPKVVDVLGFCTKNPKPMIPYLDELKEYGQFWYITITAFERDMEPNVPPVDDVIESVRTISKKVGKNAVSWRYTPIIINEKYTVERHVETFERIASKLDGYVRLVAFGFLDLYDKLKRNSPDIKDCKDEDKIRLSMELKKIAEKHHMIIRLCSKEKWLKEYGIDVDGCMRLEDYEAAIGCSLEPKKKMQARKGFCSCLLSNDIGSYNSCPHLCRYCYANGNRNLVLENYRKHDDNSPFLIGNSLKGDNVMDARQESWKVRKIQNLFDL